MIEQNLGAGERLLRLLLSLCLFYGLYREGLHGPIEWLLLVAAIFLFMNAVSARCYLWSWLGFNTCDAEREQCRPGGAN